MCSSLEIDLEQKGGMFVANKDTVLDTLEVYWCYLRVKIAIDNGSVHMSYYQLGEHLIMIFLSDLEQREGMFVANEDTVLSTLQVFDWNLKIISFPMTYMTLLIPPIDTIDF